VTSRAVCFAVGGCFALAMSTALAPPAAAEQNPACPAYPPGQAHRLTISASPGTVPPGAAVSLTARARRGLGTVCGGQVLRLYIAKPNHLARFHTFVTTDSQGLATYVGHPGETFSYKWRWYYGTVTSVTSGNGRVAVTTP
jgi:hypothetical protein